MPLPSLPLPTNIVPGDTGHANLHNDANEATNYLLSDAQAQNTVLAAPTGVAGAAEFRLLTAADIPALTIKSVIGGYGNGGTVPASATRFAAFFGQSLNGTEVNVAFPLPIGGNAKNLYLRINGSQGAGGSLVFTLRKNGSDTTLFVVVPSGSAAGIYSGNGNTVSLSAGDYITLKIVNNDAGSVSATIGAFSFELDISQ